jgi:flavin reductase (DIM6/NTAB) family NADH-FMN oxidoreductase RutF
MTPEESKAAVKDFLRRCVSYADASIERKVNDGDEGELTRWRAYREFTAYAISEIDGGELDSWFDSQPAANPAREPVGATPAEIPPDANWLSALVAPRPVALLSTRSQSGVHNLCPVTSHSVLANHPPLIGVSLSVDQQGKERDSLTNLRDGSAASLIVLPANWKSATIVDKTARNLPPEESEWDLLEEDPVVRGDSPAFHPAAVAVIECHLAELHPLPEGSVATLAILAVDRLLIPESMSKDVPNLAEIGPLLSQFGSHRLTPGPSADEWSHTVNLD